MDNGKINRVLGLYSKFMNGAWVSKSEEALNYGVNERTIQRDIDDIRCHLESDTDHDGFLNSIVYDRTEKKFRLKKIYHEKLTNSEILAVCKILLDSRALRKDDMDTLLDKLISCCVPEKNQKVVEDLIRNETFHYVEPRHKKHILNALWEIGEAIHSCKYLDIEYERTIDRKIVKRRVKPLAIMFSEYYFYLTAFIDDEDTKKGFDLINDSFPTIYRIDRIKKCLVSTERFHIPYNNRFEEGEFRKRIQFMYGGKLQKIKFVYSGRDVDAILDRLPTAKILSESDEGYTISAEVFGEGIHMWLKSQDSVIRLIKEGDENK